MPYVVTAACIDVLDKTCMQECPVDCIYEGRRAVYINPEECIDCGACEPVCPSEAIYYMEDLLGPLVVHQDDNARFFSGVLPGRDAPLGTPRGAQSVGPVGVDTDLVRDFDAGLEWPNSE